MAYWFLFTRCSNWFSKKVLLLVHTYIKKFEIFLMELSLFFVILSDSYYEMNILRVHCPHTFKLLLLSSLNIFLVFINENVWQLLSGCRSLWAHRNTFLVWLLSMRLITITILMANGKFLTMLCSVITCIVHSKLNSPRTQDINVTFGDIMLIIFVKFLQFSSTFASQHSLVRL